MYQRTQFDNGVRIVTEYIPYVRSVSIGLWIKSGSRNEPRNMNGASHFIEHMLFKGTRGRTAREIAEAIDGVGGQMNAFTTKEYTCYYARVLDTHLSFAMDILADMLLNSLFDEGEIEKEKGVVLEEIKMYEDTPDELVHDVLAQAMWDSGPLGLNTLGTSETVSRFTRDSLLHYMSSQYTPDNLIVAAAGNLKHEAVVEDAIRLFGALDRPAAPVLNRPQRTMFRASVRFKEIEQVHLCLGAKGYPRHHRDKFALLVLDAILGGGMSSRLFQGLREERGLVYSTYSYHSAYEDTGAFVVYAGMSPQNVDIVMDLILDEFSNLLNNGIKPEELERGKEQLKGGMLLGLENTSSRMSRIAKLEMFHDRYYTPGEIINIIDSVTLDDVQRVAYDILGKSDLAAAIVGPYNGDLNLAARLRERREAGAISG
ncbi:MAG TPA: insulinase family protein [Firmicutes bacterium]|nr:insulinase family protein [Bacillota bacterium]